MSEQTVFPALRYADAKAAIDWLGRAFGFEPRVVYDEGDVVHHAELQVPGGMIMLGSVRGDSSEYQKVAPPPGSTSIYVVVEDTDAHHARAKEAGAEILMDLHDTDYGSRDYTARDLEGNVWSFGTYQPWSVTH
jgi:uncharacterized glyoxalase superfamily protein PhnB